MRKNGVDSLNKNIPFEEIENNKITLKNNEQLLSLIQKTINECKLKHNEILIKYFKDKNVLKTFEFNRKRYKFIREGYLSKRTLTYVLVYFDILLKQLEQIHKRKSISNIFLDLYFENESKLSCFCNNIVGDIFDVHKLPSYDFIEKRSMLILTDDFLTGLNKMKLYYNMFFGKTNIRYLMNYKNELNNERLKDFIYRISKNLNDKEIMFIYILCKRDIESLSKEDIKFLENIVKTFSMKKSNIIVEPNFLTNEDNEFIKKISTFLNGIDNKIVFKDYEKCSKVINKDSIEVYTFLANIGNNIYHCKVRKMIGLLHLFVYDNQKIIFKDRIYFLEDLKRFVIVIKEYNTLKENSINFWNN